MSYAAYVDALASRHRPIFDYCKTRLPARTASIFDAGCGDGRLLKIFVEELKISKAVGVDLDEGALALAASRLPQATFLAGDAFDVLQGSPEKFDAIIAAHFIYYVERAKWRGAVDAFRSRLHSDGAAVIVLVSSTSEPFSGPVHSKLKDLSENARSQDGAWLQGESFAGWLADEGIAFEADHVPWRFPFADPLKSDQDSLVGALAFLYRLAPQTILGAFDPDVLIHESQKKHFDMKDLVIVLRRA